MNYQFLLLLVLAAVGMLVFKHWTFEVKRKRRRDYYRNEYLKSDAWKRKRYVVLKRDNWRCVYCGGRATQVHHKRYARKNIGKEPIEWLVSVCKPCHDSQHHKVTRTL
jgi:5-methylcytosine-specific restriction endonuclease McrA